MRNYHYYKFYYFFMISVLLISCSERKNEMTSGAEIAIKKVIEKAYIEGIHGNQDENIIKSGFHQDFNMLVLNNNNIEKVNVDEWLIRLEKMKADNPELWTSKTTFKFLSVKVTNNAAVAILDVFKGQIHFSTDYMLLYKFDEGWRIVSKIYTIPQ